MSQGFLVGFPQRLFSAAGVPANGWTIQTYISGTTTPLETFSNPTLTSSNGTTITTDSAGYFRCYVAAGVLIKALVFDENSVPQADPAFDNLEPMIDPTAPDPSVTAVPTGGIVLYGKSTAPTGFLLCDGSLVSRSTYAALFAIISTAYGTGDGSTTFGLPDMRQRFPLGLAASGTGAVLGVTGGAIDHTHTGPSHTHAVVVTRDGWGATLNSPSTSGRLNTGSAAGAGVFVSSYQPTADLSVTSAAGGTGASGTANPAFQTFTYIIKT